jgi:hypothetical protein
MSATISIREKSCEGEYFDLVVLLQQIIVLKKSGNTEI